MHVQCLHAHGCISAGPCAGWSGHPLGTGWCVPSAPAEVCLHSGSVLRTGACLRVPPCPMYPRACWPKHGMHARCTGSVHALVWVGLPTYLVRVDLFHPAEVRLRDVQTRGLVESRTYGLMNCETPCPASVRRRTTRCHAMHASHDARPPTRTRSSPWTARRWSAHAPSVLRAANIALPLVAMLHPSPSCWTLFAPPPNVRRNPT